MGRITTVFFDFGGVITAASPFTLIGEIGAEAGVPPEQVLEIMLGPYHEDTDHPFHRMERGELSGIEWFALAAAAMAEVGVTLEPAHMMSVFSALGVHDVVIERIRRLRDEGYKTGIITNNAKEASEGWRSMLDVDGLFDIVVDSSAVGMRKPNPAIYRHALGLLGVEPGQAVFLDDAEGNVAAARAIGMRAILVGPDPRPALEELDRILVS